jgi:DNA-binding transcriptional ArsR family regulator
MAAAVEARLREGGRLIEEVTSRGIAHRIRIEILAALHEGPASASQLAKILREDASLVYNHIKELLKDGCIEVAFEEEVRNHTVAYYRVIELPFFSDEAIAEMTPEQRQITAALILQASAAESLAALWAGKMHSDPRVWLAWKPVVLDHQGREDAADEMQRNWDRLMEIAGESVNRRAELGEGEEDTGKTCIVATFAFERGRSGAHEPGRGIIEWPAPSDS